jgi:hypothetical protein
MDKRRSKDIATRKQVSQRLPTFNKLISVCKRYFKVWQASIRCDNLKSISGIDAE